MPNIKGLKSAGFYRVKIEIQWAIHAPYLKVDLFRSGPFSVSNFNFPPLYREGDGQGTHPVRDGARVLASAAC